ncbi:glycerol-3-phosphate dehydrogenase/oxidase [Chthonobacter rhizosphaerae]|uniref:glycerol-3-phosphate dehydrogenase/oxidase n=1 Tax=Chthonobacter rhizosphaerae TaxID=2735553 RepID=UPI001AEDF0BB|nr:glycerol-3-phosphate dehydrogenase/oxidase [Chthonobacter rhizosphaerae]
MVLIVGGGINGAGVYRDLAAQSVPALLVERGDFASGTSAAPSRLIHGGLRYLETGEVALVRESVEERNLLLLNAPHVVRPIPCWIPLQSWFGGAGGAILRFLKLTKDPGRKGAIPVKLGLALYDLFGNQNRTMPRHRLFSRQAARATIPGLSPATRAVAEYFDARITHPERLTMEVIADAEADCAASMALPYVSVAGRDGAVVVLEDQISGERFTIRPKLLVNTSGAWLDQVQDRLGVGERLVGGTKGSHLVLRNSALAGELGDRMLYFETADHRACLAYALGDDRVLLGTTDLRTDDPDEKTCSDAEIDYLFTVLTAVMPTTELDRNQILFAFAGVRPLPRTQAGAAGAISRDHTVKSYGPTLDRPFPILALVGGKWTTYRACAEQITDAALGRLGLPRTRSTKSLKIGGGVGFPANPDDQTAWIEAAARDTKCAVARMQVLAYRYGVRARAIAEIEVRPGQQTSWLAPNYSEAEVRWVAREERVSRLEDVVLRRTLMAFEGATDRHTLERVASAVGAELGWATERQQAEVEALATLLRDRHRVKVGPTPSGHARPGIEPANAVGNG